MQINFIPIDYDYFDYKSKNYAKIIGRTDKGKQACIIDSFEPFFWAIFKPKTSDKKIKQIQKKKWMPTSSEWKTPLIILVRDGGI